MEFRGTITNILGYPGRPTFIITDHATRNERRVSIIDAHDIRRVSNTSVDLFLNGNLLVDNHQEVIERLVIVTVRNIGFNNGLFLIPEDYLHKQVDVYTPHPIV